MFRLNSSIRHREPEKTLEAARSFSDHLGISRVTDVTRLDILDIPVFASVRPSAMEGSLCVNAGKGIIPIEAHVGAYMEAIEFALAEPGASSQVQVVLATARDVLDGSQRSTAILDLCPIANEAIDLSAPLACVEATEVVSQRSTLVPAELVLLPYVNRPGTGYFGSHSNGLASGNTVTEATLHAVYEVIERDIRSFQVLRDEATTIKLQSLPSSALRMVDKIRSAGLDIVIRATPNRYGLAFFEALIFDHDESAPFALAAGYGCHCVREIALLRGITEAAQSRLSAIHGGRDDLAETYKKLTGYRHDSLRAVAAPMAGLRGEREGMQYDDWPEGELDSGEITEALGSVIECLQRAGMPRSGFKTGVAR